MDVLKLDDKTIITQEWSDQRVRAITTKGAGLMSFRVENDGDNARAYLTTDQARELAQAILVALDEEVTA